MESHDQFANRVLGASKDVSLPVLQDLLGQGYDMTDWATDAGAQDAACIAKNLEKKPLADFIGETQYEAPIYSKTHVGCKCGVRVTGPELPEVFVTAFGVQ